MKDKGVMLAVLAIVVGFGLTGCGTLTRLGVTEDVVVAGVELALKRQGLEGAVTPAQTREIVAIVKAHERLQEIGTEIEADARVQRRIEEIVNKYVVDGVVVDPVVVKPVEAVPEGANELIWKPVSEKDGRLVVLLPACIVADSVKIGEDVTAPDPARANGNRQHIRPGKPGAAYGAGVAVVAYRDGSIVGQWTIANGALREVIAHACG